MMRNVMGKIFLTVLAMVLLTTVCFATSEKEPNDSADVATPIPVGERISATIGDKNDYDYYRVDIPEAGSVEIEFMYDFMNSDRVYLCTWIYDSEINLLQTTEFPGNALTYTRSIKLGVDAGTYYIKVGHDSWYYTGNYEFKVIYTPSPNWEKELNETIVTPTPVQVNNRVYASLMRKDVDYFRFDLPKDGVISVNFAHDYVDADRNYLTLCIYNETGTEIQSKDYMGNELQSVDTVKKGLPAGTYYIEVTNGSYYYNGEYNFYISYSESDFWEKELNDTPVSATPIKTNNAVSGSLVKGDDGDYYSFNIQKGGMISILFAHEYSRYDNTLYISVINSNNNTIKKYSYDGPLTATTITSELYLAAGRYYLYITHGSYYFNGEYQFKINHTIFDDVRPGQWYYDAVSWAVSREPAITNGVSATTFAPENGCTRAQVVTFLWRAAGCPEPKGSYNPFSDVKSNAYYYKAVLWAVEKNITSGTSATKFSPEDSCTRAQIVTFLWRFEGKPVAGTPSNPFKDVQAGSYYYDAVLWAVDNKITTGTSSTKFSPEDTCTRAQVVTFLYRDIEN